MDQDPGEDGPRIHRAQNLVRREGLHTVCEEAGCPNIYECWEDREATFLIGGDQCTRRCDFCQIDTGKPRRSTGTSRVASPSRSSRWTCATPRSPASPATTCPTAVPGSTPRPRGRSTHSTRLRGRAAGARLQRRFRSSWRGLLARPEVFAHNVETVPRIFKRIRPGFRYDRSLDVITRPATSAWSPSPT